MKKLIIVLIIGLVSIATKAQNELPKAIQDINADVAKVNNEQGDFTIINSLHFSKPYAHSICINNNQITKIREYKPVSKEVLIIEYYFKYSRLIFARSGIVGEDTGEEDLLQKEYSISDTNFRKGYFDYDELISQEYLVYKGKDTLFWGNVMQREGYRLWHKYQKLLNFNPYTTMQYDSVVAYDFMGKEGAIITDGSGRLNRTAKNGISLSKQQIDSLTIAIADTTTYGGASAACFNPRMGIVFYYNGNVISTINICFECNFMISSENLPAMGFHTLTGGGDDYIVRSPRFGFSPLGRKKLKALCLSLGLQYCPKEAGIWDAPLKKD